MHAASRVLLLVTLESVTATSPFTCNNKSINFLPPSFLIPPPLPNLQPLCRDLFSALDKAEDILTKRRFIAGDVLTEADIRLFVTLIRFDPVYVVYFKTDRKCIREYPALKEYVTDLYQTPGITESVDIHHIKTHYFTSHPLLNAYAIVPGGPAPWWEEPHDRYKMTKQAVAFDV